MTHPEPTPRTRTRTRTRTRPAAVRLCFAGAALCLLSAVLLTLWNSYAPG